MRTLSRLFTVLTGTLLGFCCVADNTPMLPDWSAPIAPAELSELPLSIFANGEGLPAGSGNAEAGLAIYKRECVMCHGAQGMGASAMELVGDRALLATGFPDKGIAVYWPYAPALFDYIRRAMPPAKPYSLTSAEIYSVIAYLFEISDLIEAGSMVNANTLANIAMPNANNFINVNDTKQVFKTKE